MRQMSQLSLDAYRNSVKPNLTQREIWVLEAIEDLGTASAESVAEHLGVGINIVSGRFTGLRKKEMIEPAYRGENHFGRLVQYYRPKHKEPIERDID